MEDRTVPTTDLIPFAFSGWPSSIVISDVTGTNTDNAISTTDTVRVDVGMLNQGNTATGTYSMSIQLDSGTPLVGNLPATNPGNGFLFSDINFGTLSAGTHTLTLTIDSANTVVEFNETNNVAVRTFVVGSVDFGDAPTNLQTLFAGTYPTTLALDGARHTIVSGFSLGTTVDADLNGQPNTAATLDDATETDDENGVTLAGPLTPGQTVNATVNVTNTAAMANPFLEAYVDFNRDGDWGDSGETVFSGAVTAGANAVPISVPGGASVGSTYARFRLSNGASALGVTGLAASGEVEDLAVVIQPASGVWQNHGPSSTQNAQVENVFPNNQVNGAIHTVLTHPTDANTMYIGSVNGGIWKTTNATAVNPTWVPQTDFLESLAIGAMAFDPTDATHNTLVAGSAAYSSFAGLGGTRGSVYRTTDGGANWTTLAASGLKTVGENISGIAARGSTIVVTSSANFGGIFRSTNGGASFSPISDEDFVSPNDNFTDLVVDASDPTGQRLYASAESTGGSSTTGGIYRSDDFGATWTKITGAGINAAMQSLLTSSNNIEMAVHPTTGRLYVAVLIGGQPRGVFHTNTGTNASPTWTQMDVPVLPIGAGVAITGATNATPIVITSTGHGLSTGQFVVVNGVGGNTAANGFFRITVVDANTFRLDGSTGNGTYTSGGTWTRVTGPSPSFKVIDEITGAQGRIHFSIAVSPTDEDLVFIGGDRQEQPNAIGDNTFGGAVFRGDASIARNPNVAPSPQWDHLTHDKVDFDPAGGTASGSSPHADSREIAFDVNGNLIEVDDGGIFKRTNPEDNTGDWFSLAGTLGVVEFHDIAYDSLTNVIIGGTQDNGTHFQTTEGSTVWDFLSGGDGGDAAVDNVTLAGSSQSIRYHSAQLLQSFRRTVFDANNRVVSSTSIPLTLSGGGNAIVPGNGTIMPFVTPFVLNAITPTRMIIGGNSNLWESSNQGNTVTNISSSIGVNFVGAIAYGGRSGGVDNADVLYVGFGTNVFVRTSGTGAPGSGVSLGGTVLDIVLDPEDWKTAYAITGNSVFVTTNEGVSWSNITGNLMSLAGAAINTIEFIPGAIGGLVVGGNLGVFTSLVSAPGTWTEVGGGVLPNVLVYDMTYNATDDVLVLGTLGRGAWTMPNASDVFGGAINENPDIEVYNPVTYVESAAPILVSPGGFVTDTDSADFDGGSLTVTITAGGLASDRLAISNTGGLTPVLVSSGNVSYSGTVVATVSGGTSDTDPLVISFNADSTPAAAHSILRAITFHNVTSDPTDAGLNLSRTLTFDLTDGDGGSDSDTKIINIIDRPELGGITSPVAFTEDGGPVLLASGGTVADPDSPDFDGGTLTVRVIGNQVATDRLSVRNVGSGTSEVGFSGGVVSFEGANVGTATGGGSGTVPFVITFNASATRAIVEAVLQNVTYENVSDNVAALTRTVRFVLTDGDGGSSPAVNLTVNLTRTNDAPVVTVGNDGTYTENGAALTLVTAAGLTDPDSPNFDTGSLTVTLTVGGLATDLLVVRNIGTGPGQVGVSSGTVSYEGVDIGTVTGGTGTDPLVVDFNASATVTAARAVLRAVAFSNTSDDPTAGGSSTGRTIQFAMADGDGGTGTGTKTFTVKGVNDKPVLSGITATDYTAGAGATVIAGTATVTDPDSGNLAFGKLTVRASTNGTVGDRFEIENQGAGFGQVGVDGVMVSFGGIVVGTFTGGVGTTALVVTFNSSSTVDAAQAVLRAVTYRNTNPTPTVTTRTVRYTLGDGDGGLSDAVDQALTIV